MFHTTYRLLTFFEAVDTIRGRKKLQKMIHLLKSAGTDFSFKYRYHHYGPYSSQLQSEMDQLVAQNFIQEKFTDGAYTYHITERGREFKEILHKDGGYSFTLQEGLLEALIDKPTSFLEMFSTYVFLLESGDTKEEAKEKAKELKPHLGEQLDEVIRAYERYII